MLAKKKNEASAEKSGGDMVLREVVRAEAEEHAGQ